MKWYKRDPDAFLVGIKGLTPDEVGAYSTVIDYFYSRDGHVPDDDYLLSRLLEVNPRTWRKLKVALFQKQKLTVNSAGCLVPNRGEYTLNEARTFAELQANRARKRWERVENNNENNDTPMPAAMPKQPQPQPQPQPHKEREVPAANAAELDLSIPDFLKREPVEVADEDPRARLFRVGKTILVSFGIAERRTGALIGQWLKARPDPIGILAAIEYARDQNVAEPVAYVSATIHGNGARKNGAKPPTLHEVLDQAIARARGDEVEGDPQMVNVTPRRS